MKIAFLGLGVMGFPMAGHLAKAGHEVTVYNRTASKSQNWLSTYEGASEESVAAAVMGADIVFACLGNDDDVRENVYGEAGAFAHMKLGAVFVDHTTASAELARELYDYTKNHGLKFIDAPVSGGQAGAENGILSIMCGGDAEVFAWVEPVMQAYGKTVKRIGDAGAGQICKMANQIAIAGLLQGLSESLHFVECAALDGKKVLEVITQGAAGSWQMSNRGETMLAREFNFGFAVEWMLKDLGIVLDESQNNGAELPITKIVRGYYEEVAAHGGKRFDTSSLITRFDK